ncbi:HTH-type transcriptional repressor YtrA [mine drainage metagenome]|uniref:HTH-type transcriptional repressor YtrA n=1 Tax=mine drainage metagenome TaxID=410659 RepID=A0A1J5S0K5_9ZZZZ
MTAMLRIDLASSVPVYEQIADGLRAEFVAATFQPGERLPTVRALAIDLGIHHNTVAQAYRQLAAEGWIELRRHHGAMAKPRSLPATPATSPDLFTRSLRELLAKALAGGVSRGLLARELSNAARRLDEGGL